MICEVLYSVKTACLTELLIADAPASTCGLTPVPALERLPVRLAVCGFYGGVSCDVRLTCVMSRQA